MTTQLQSILEIEGLTDLLPLFIEQEINDSILGNLSDSDLKNLGIDKMGIRRRLLGAFEAAQRSLTERDSSLKVECVTTTPQDQFTYEARNGEIIITGFSGRGHVVVPGKFDGLPLPVRAIGPSAFSGNGMIISMVLPEGLWKIDDSAFSGCSSLVNISIPEGVTSIGGSAFFGCSSLVSISIPESVTSIGGSPFFGCSSLPSITIPESVKSIVGDKCIKSLFGSTWPDKKEGFFAKLFS